MAVSGREWRCLERHLLDALRVDPLRVDRAEQHGELLKLDRARAVGVDALRQVEQVVGRLVLREER